MTLTEPQKFWVAALRSGRFKQTTHVLCRLDEQGEPVGYCCLGVACELAREAGVALTVSVGAYSLSSSDKIPARRYEDGSYYPTLISLPDAVRDWVGMESDSGFFREGGTNGFPRTLAGLNDSGETFERIADIIESAPSGLFAEAKS